MFSCLLKYSELNLFKHKLSQHIHMSKLYEENYRHLWSPINPLMPGGNNK